jgi:hypothetical protein
VVNLSFSFRTPSTSSYLLVGVNEREDRRLPTVETRTHEEMADGWCLSLLLSLAWSSLLLSQKEMKEKTIAFSLALGDSRRVKTRDRERAAAVNYQ